MRKTANWNRFDIFIILLIVSIAFGGIGMPLTVTRIAAIMLFPWVLNTYAKNPNSVPYYAKFFITIWLVFSCISLIWSPDKSNGIKFLLYNSLCICDFLAICLLSTKARQPLKSIIIGWAILFLSTLPIALNEIINSVHLGISFMDQANIRDLNGGVIQRTFASVTFGNLNSYTVIACYCLLFTLTSFFLYKRFKLLFITAFAGEIYVVAMNASRGGFLCITIATVIALICLSRRRLINRSQVILFILLFGFILYRFSGSLFLQIEYKMHYQGFEDLGRLSIYEAAWKVFIDYCTLGCGIGGLQTALESAGASIAATHNMYLEFLAQYGFIPFIAFLYFCYMPAFHLLKQRDIYNKYLGSSYILFSFPLFIIDSNYLADPAFWIFLASIASFNILTKRSLRDKHKRPILCN